MSDYLNTPYMQRLLATQRQLVKKELERIVDALIASESETIVFRCNKDDLHKHQPGSEQRIREIVRDELRNSLVFYKDASGAICEVEVKEEDDG